MDNFARSLGLPSAQEKFQIPPLHTFKPYRELTRQGAPTLDAQLSYSSEYSPRSLVPPSSSAFVAHPKNRTEFHLHTTIFVKKIAARRATSLTTLPTAFIYVKMRYYNQSELRTSRCTVHLQPIPTMKVFQRFAIRLCQVTTNPLYPSRLTGTSGLLRPADTEQNPSRTCFSCKIIGCLALRLPCTNHSQQCTINHFWRFTTRLRRLT